MKYIRNCPECGDVIAYPTKKLLWQANQRNYRCKKCRYQNLRVKRMGMKFSSEWKKNLSLNHADVSGKNNPFFNRTHSEETKRKIRLSTIKTLNEKYGGGICPKYNPIACQQIDEYGKQHGYNFKHALNGGEFYIKELGYWVDGYDKEKNVVIEYYELHHKRSKERIRDSKRLQEIINLLRCDVIILKE